MGGACVGSVRMGMREPAVHSTRLDCIDRPQATHPGTTVGRGGHEPTHPPPKQADAFTHTRKIA
eukprot:2455263-Prymnesium_polylepis.1